MMLIKLFIFFLLLLILPDWYIYRAYIHRVSQKWIRRAYWIPTLFLVTGMTVIFSIHEPMPDSMYRLSNFLLIFLCFAVPKAIFVIVILIMKLLFLISGRRLYGVYIAGVVSRLSHSPTFGYPFGQLDTKWKSNTKSCGYGQCRTSRPGGFYR